MNYLRKVYANAKEQEAQSVNVAHSARVVTPHLVSYIILAIVEVSRSLLARASLLPRILL